MIASGITPKPIVWFWQDRIFAASLCILQALPSDGKGCICYDLAARVSAGLPMPGELQGADPSNVLILEAEDSPDEIIVPSLVASQADCSRIDIETHMDLPADLGRLEALIQQRHVKFVTINPLWDFVSGISRNEIVKTVLTPLADIAKRHTTTIVLVVHLGKSTQYHDPIYSGLGATALVASARTVLQIDADPSPRDPHRKVLRLVKTGRGSGQPLNFRTRKLNDVECTPVVVEWIGPVEASMPAESHIRRREHAYAVEVLRTILTEHDGMAAVREVEEEAVSRGGKGVSKRTLQRAKESLGVYSVKGGGRGASWYWCLPTISPDEARDRLQQITRESADPYSVLGVPPDAPWPEVEKAYREAVKKCHPDHNPDPDAASKFREVQEAWETLCNSKNRDTVSAAIP